MKSDMKKDEFYLQMIQRINDYEYTRNQNIDNKSVNLITIAGVFIGIGAIILGFIGNQIEIHFALKLSLFVNIFLFFASIIISIFNYRIRGFKRTDFEQFIESDDENYNEKVRHYVKTEYHNYKDNLKIIDRKVFMFKINFILNLAWVFIFIINIFLIFSLQL